MNEKWNFEKITDDIKNSIKSLREEVQKEWWFLKFLLKKLWLKRDQEVQETQTETQNNLNDLASDLIDDKINFADEKISDEEKKVLEKIKELDKNDKYIENWLNWIDDIEDEVLKTKEIQTLLSDLQKEADDDKDKKWDLDADEFKKIWEKAKNKKELCEKVYEAVANDNTISDDKKNKTSVLKAYNDVLSENNWDISNVTQEKIIEKLQNSSES